MTQNGVYLFDSSANTLSGDFIGTDSSGYDCPAQPARRRVARLRVLGQHHRRHRRRRRHLQQRPVGRLSHRLGTKGNVVEGNEIGTNTPGNTALPNGNNGVDIVSGASFNTVGGTVAGSANVISGNAYNGVVIAFAGASDNLVEGNLIGTDAGGTVALPNGANGVEIQGGATNNTIGGTTAGARDIISGNGYAGVLITDSGTNGNVVEGDYIGTNAAGTAALANAVTAWSSRPGPPATRSAAQPPAPATASRATSTTAWRSPASTTSGNVVEGDYIGTNAAGTAPWPTARRRIRSSAGRRATRSAARSPAPAT